MHKLHCHSLARMGQMLLAGLLMLLCLVTAKPAHAATATVGNFDVQYSPFHGDDTVPINCTSSWQTQGLTGRFILYQVVTKTNYDGTVDTYKKVIQLTDYGTVNVLNTISQTLYINGSLEAAGQVHGTYHYELLSEVIDPKTLVYSASASKVSPEFTVN